MAKAYSDEELREFYQEVQAYNLLSGNKDNYANLVGRFLATIQARDKEIARLKEKDMNNILGYSEQVKQLQSRLDTACGLLKRVRHELPAVRSNGAFPSSENDIDAFLADRGKV
jgi:hypothetical protein